MKAFARWAGLCLLALAGLQIFFVVRIASMAIFAPQSTTFERSEAWRITNEKGTWQWHQQWVNYPHIADTLKRAVIAAEDDSFNYHDGVDWEALEKAREKNALAEQRAAKRKPLAATTRPVKIVGGSTITQQLAKNLFLSGERTLLRKGQELVLTLLLETLLSKQRILEIYLNHVEWGEGVFGAQAAAQHYFGKSAAKLNTYEAARLAVMLPRPKYFEKLPNSNYLSQRTGTIMARMGHTQIP